MKGYVVTLYELCLLVFGYLGKKGLQEGEGGQRATISYFIFSDFFNFICSQVIYSLFFNVWGGFTALLGGHSFFKLGLI